MRYIRKKKRKLGRKQYALALFACLVVLELLSAVFNMKNQTMIQAKRDLEIQEGWGSSRVIWEEKLGESLLERTRLRLHTLDGGCALVEYAWNMWDGWNQGVRVGVETREGWPIQARYSILHDYYKVYVTGYLTDPDIEVERVTFGLFHWEDDRGFVVDPEDSVTLCQEDCISEGGRTYFVCEIDLSQRLREDEMQNFGQRYGGVLVHVTDENGQPILWEDGWGDDYGEWMNLGH